MRRIHSTADHDLVAQLHADGLGARRISRRTGIPESTVNRWIHPDYAERNRALSRKLKERYRGVCVDCGGPTAWPSGSGEHKRCQPCHRTFAAAVHGTRSKYQLGCRCDDCTAAATAAHRALKGTPPPRHGTISGYVNYGCRCDACKQAGSHANWAYRQLRQARDRHPL